MESGVLLYIYRSSTKDGPQLSTARRAARQRAMIRKELRTTDSDGVSVQSDDSPASGNYLTLNAPIATKVVCFSRLLKCLRSFFGK